MRSTAWLFALAAFVAAVPVVHADGPAITDGGEVRIEDAVRLIEDDSPAASRKMPLLIKNIEATLRTRPNDPDYMVLLARATSRLHPVFGMYRGVQLADEALKVKPGHLEALLYKAEAAAQSNCRPCAEEQIRLAEKAGAPAARLHVLRAGLYMMENMEARQNPGGAAYDNAGEDAWRRVVAEAEKALAAEQDPIRKARLYGWLFDMHQQTGDAAKARAAAEAAIAANPGGRHFVEPLRTGNGVGNALHRVLIEIKACSAECEIEVCDDHARLEQLRHAPGHVVTDRARSDAALGADERKDVFDRIRLGIVV